MERFWLVTNQETHARHLAREPYLTLCGRRFGANWLRRPIETTPDDPGCLPCWAKYRKLTVVPQISANAEQRLRGQANAAARDLILTGQALSDLLDMPLLQLLQELLQQAYDKFRLDGRVS